MISRILCLIIIIWVLQNPGLIAQNHTSIWHRDAGWQGGKIKIIGGRTNEHQANSKIWNLPDGLDGRVLDMVIARGAVGNGQSRKPSNVGLAILDDGTVVAWGDEDYGLTQIPKGLSNVIQLACGPDFAVALDSNGACHRWGTVEFEVPGMDIASISADGSQLLCLTKTGRIIATGIRGSKYGAPPETLGKVIKVVARGSAGFALQEDGKLITWGSPGKLKTADLPNDLPPLSDFDIAQPYAMGISKSDASLVIWGDKSHKSYREISDLAGQKALAVKAGSLKTFYQDENGDWTIINGWQQKEAAPLKSARSLVLNYPMVFAVYGNRKPVPAPATQPPPPDKQPTMTETNTPPDSTPDDPRLEAIIKQIKTLQENANQGEAAKITKYIADLKVLEKKVQATGDLDKVLLVSNERKSWESGKPTAPINPKDTSVPLDLRKLRYFFDQEIAKIRMVDLQKSEAQKAAIIKKLNALVIEITKEGKIDEALKIRGIKDQYSSGKYTP